MQKESPSLLLSRDLRAVKGQDKDLSPVTQMESSKDGLRKEEGVRALCETRQYHEPGHRLGAQAGRTL